MTPKVCTLIGSDKGGVGKSLLTQIFVLAHDHAGTPLKLVEIDHQRKLTSLLGRRVDLALDGSAGIDLTLRDRRAVESFFNPCYAVWSAGPSVTDLGANVTTPLLAWMKHNDIAGVAAEDGIDFRFVAVASPDDQSLRSALSALEEARRVLGPDASLFLVLNDTGGVAGFAPYHGLDLWKRVVALPHSHGVAIIELPFCDSAVMEWGRAQGKTVLDLLQDVDGTIKTIAADAGLDRLALRVHVRRFTEWVRAIQSAMGPLFDQPRPRLQAAE